jgi:CRISPR-associated exonuclease Cas4
MTALFLALAALAALIWLVLRRKAGVLPPGQVVYSDTDRRAIAEPITSHRLRMSGKPDYVYSMPDQAVPIEVKRHRAGRFGPRDRDVIQLLAYCVLIEDVWGVAVMHGLIEYADRRFTVPYGPEQRRQVLELAEEIRRDRRAADVARSHHEAWKCRRCGYSETCGQALR